MSADAREVNKPAAIAAAALVISICTLPVMLIPYLLGAAAHDFALEPRQLGWVAAGVIGGVLAVMASSMLWVRLYNWRALTTAGAIIAGGGYLLAGHARSLGAMVTLLLLGSCGSGIANAVSVCALSDTTNPDRNFGFSFFVQALASGLIGFVATGLGQQWGLSHLLELIGACFALALVLTMFLPASGIKSGAMDAMAPAPVWLRVWMGLGGMLLLYAGPTAVWAFFERIGEADGFSEHSVGNAIATGLLLGAPGALLSSISRKRFGRIGPLVLSTLAMIVTFAAAVVTRDFMVYLFSGLLLLFLWNFGLAFQYGALSDADMSGRLIVLAPTFQGLGAVVGPAIAGLLVQDRDYTPVATWGGLSVIGGLVLILWLCRSADSVAGAAIGIPPSS